MSFNFSVYSLENFNSIYIKGFNFTNTEYKDDSLKALVNGFIKGIDYHLINLSVPLKSLRIKLRKDRNNMVQILQDRVFNDETENAKYKYILKSNLYVDIEAVKYIKNNIDNKPIKNILSNFYSYGFLLGLIYGDKKTKQFFNTKNQTIKVKDNVDLSSFLREFDKFSKKYKT